MQLDMLALLRNPPVRRPIDPYGPVVQGDVHEHLFLPHPRLAWNRADIKLHRHTDGLWMWSTSVNCDESGRGYQVGPKWGNFAESRDDALYYAVQEIANHLNSSKSADARAIKAWAEALA